MSQLKTVIGNIVNTAKIDIAERKFANVALVAQQKAGLNVSTEDAQLSNQLSHDLDSTIDNLISKIELSMEGSGIHFTEAQKAAARNIAPYAFAPKVYANQLTNMRQSQVRGDSVSFSSEAMGVEDMLTPEVVQGVISNEAYDGQALKNSVYFSIAYNLGAARQDEFGETFFPTITIDALQSDINISIEYTSLFNEFNRSITGAPDKWDRVPVIKALYDNSIFATDKNKVVPVFRENENKDYFLADYKHADVSTGSEIVTAPLKLDNKISLLGISQTDAQLAKGTMDNTDALDRSIKLEHLYFEVQNKDKSKTDVISFDPSIYTTNTHAFVANPQDHHKSMILNYKAPNFIVNISSIKNAKGAESEVFKEAVGAAYANYKLVFEVAVNGEANVMEGNIEVHGVKMNLIEIQDAAGSKVAKTDAAYNELKAYADTCKLVGYEVEAYRTNTNIRTRGLLVTNDSYNHIYAVPFHAGITALFPVSSQTGTDNDAGTLTSQVALAGVYTSAYAVKKLVDFSNALSAQSQNGLLAGVKEGVGSFLVNPWYNAESFDLSSVVDSTQSADRDDDIRAALVLRIKNEVLNMYKYSNYGAAFEVLRGNLGGSIGVIVGTDPRLKTLLVKDGDTIALGDNFEAKVVSTLNPLIDGKIYITFGVFDANRNTTPNPLNFGNCVWSPTLTYDVQKTHNGAVSRELHNMPRFLHIIHLPILSVFEVRDVANVFNKIPVYAKSIGTVNAPTTTQPNPPAGGQTAGQGGQTTTQPETGGKDGQTTTKPEENKTPATGDKK